MSRPDRWGGPASEEDIAEATSDRYIPWHLERELESIAEGWVVYDLEIFSGRDDLSETEKQYFRQAIRSMRDGDGLVETWGGNAT